MVCTIFKGGLYFSLLENKSFNNYTRFKADIITIIIIEKRFGVERVLGSGRNGNLKYSNAFFAKNSKYSATLVSLEILAALIIAALMLVAITVVQVDDLPDFLSDLVSWGGLWYG